VPEKLLSLGTYPDTPLAAARKKRDDARRLLASGVDPSVDRKAKKIERSTDNILEAVAREWVTNRAAKWSRKHKARTIVRWLAAI